MHKQFGHIVDPIMHHASPYACSLYAPSGAGLIEPYTQKIGDVDAYIRFKVRFHDNSDVDAFSALFTEQAVQLRILETTFRVHIWRGSP